VTRPATAKLLLICRSLTFNFIRRSTLSLPVKLITKTSSSFGPAIGLLGSSESYMYTVRWPVSTGTRNEHIMQTLWCVPLATSWTADHISNWNDDIQMCLWCSPALFSDVCAPVQTCQAVICHDYLNVHLRKRRHLVVVAFALLRLPFRTVHGLPPILRDIVTLLLVKDN